MPSISPVSMSTRGAIAHQVEIVEDVGATLHIEPNDTPRAGEEALAWFALTRKGGQTIPLSDCDCQLAIYAQAQGQSEGDTASITPSLTPVDAEGYEDIPGARFTFPDVGAYTLVISGSPKQPDSFTPFELSFDVTVAAGQSTQAPAAASTDSPEAVPERPTGSTTSSSAVNSPEPKSPEPKEERQGLPKIVLPIFLGLSVVFLMGTAISQRKNRQKP